MTKYEFRCRACGVFVLASHEAGNVPEFDKKRCPRCKRDTEHQRWYSFGSKALGDKDNEFGSDDDTAGADT